MITNVATCALLNCPFDLKALTYKEGNITMNLTSFPCAIWKHKIIGGTCMVLLKGRKMVKGKVGPVKYAKVRILRYARKIQNEGWNVNTNRVKCVRYLLPCNL